MFLETKLGRGVLGYIVEDIISSSNIQLINFLLIAFEKHFKFRQMPFMFMYLEYLDTRFYYSLIRGVAD